MITNYYDWESEGWAVLVVFGIPIGLIGAAMSIFCGGPLILSILLCVLLFAALFVLGGALTSGTTGVFVEDNSYTREVTKSYRDMPKSLRKEYGKLDIAALGNMSLEQKIAMRDAFNTATVKERAVKEMENSPKYEDAVSRAKQLADSRTELLNTFKELG